MRKLRKLRGVVLVFGFYKGFVVVIREGWTAIKELKLKSLIFKTKCDDISGEEGVCR